MSGQLGDVGTVAYIASAAVVRLLDYLSVHAKTAQIIQDAGPMHTVACEGCVRGPERGWCG